MKNKKCTVGTNIQNKDRRNRKNRHHYNIIWVRAKFWCSVLCLCFVFFFFFAFVRCPMLPVSLDCPFWIAPSGFYPQLHDRSLPELGIGTLIKGSGLNHFYGPYLHSFIFFIDLAEQKYVVYNEYGNCQRKAWTWTFTRLSLSF